MITEMDELPKLVLGDFTFQLELGELSEKSKDIAARELRETPEVQKKAVQELKDLIKDEPELTLPDFDEFFVKFLRPCKFYPESARDLMKRYFQFKIKHQDVYENLTPIGEENIFKQNILTVMPNRDQLGRRIVLIELGKTWNHKECSLDEVFKGNVLFSEAACLEPETQVNGVVVIFDMNGLSLTQTWQFTPSFAKRIVDWLQDAMPLRIKGFHIINQPKIFNVVFALFKPFLREKLKNRIVFHGDNRESLHKFLSPECLPACYGGTTKLRRVDGYEWYQLLIKCNAEYEAINKLGYPMKESKKKKK